MKEEDKILKKIGTENPFRVPDGYFENLTSEVMNRLPEKEKLTAVQTEPTIWQKVRPWLYMTAMFIGAALIIRVASSEHTPSVERMAADDTETEMEYINMGMQINYSKSLLAHFYLFFISFRGMSASLEPPLSNSNSHSN